MTEAEKPFDPVCEVTLTNVSTTQVVNLNKDMKPNKDSFAVEKKTAVKDSIYLRNLHRFERIVQQINNNQAICKKLSTRETQRRNRHNFIASNLQCSQLKQVWANRGLPVDRASLQVAAAGEGTFDMRRLNESLPSEPYTEGEVDSEHQQGYLSHYERMKVRTLEQLELFRKSALKLNSNYPSSSSNAHQPVSLSNIAKKTYGDIRRVWTFQPLRARMDPCSSSNSSTNRIRFSVLELTEEKTEEIQRQRVQLQQGLSLYNHFQSQIDAGSYQQGNNQENRRNWNIQNNLQNPEPESFVRNRDGRQSQVSLKMQQLHDSVTLSRQMNRLSVANSRRGGIAEALEECETKEDVSDQNIQERARILREKKKRMKDFRNLQMSSMSVSLYHLTKSEYEQLD